jgi:capsule polysaccharide export protein KpsC/LpsZ
MFESKCLFPSQEIGLSFIFEEFKNDENIHFYLRVHPNLSTVHYNYHKRIYNFEKKYRNVTVISSSSTISTYSLIDNAKKVIVFGSSTGAEACYSGKPVILLGGSFYYYLDITHIPENTESLLHLITNNINPKPKLEAIKYGYYLMNYKIYTSVNSQDPKPLRFLGINLGVGWDFLKINDSMIIFKIKERLYKGIIRFIGNKLYSLPIKGK